MQNPSCAQAARKGSQKGLELQANLIILACREKERQTLVLRLAGSELILVNAGFYENSAQSSGVRTLKTDKRQLGGKPSSSDEPLVITPIPALVVILLNLEEKKGAPLSEAEVLEARDNAVSVALPLSARLAVDEGRGYQDINPENVWEEWLAARTQLRETKS